jgi:hypothetical protein
MIGAIGWLNWKLLFLTGLKENKEKYSEKS